MTNKILGCGFCLREGIRRHYGFDPDLGLCKQQKYTARSANFADLADPAVQELLSSLATKNTAFFRDLFLFKLVERLAETLMQKGRASLNIWSAGCASGQEPYSVAMLMRARDWPVKILGTDILKSAVDQAASGKDFRTPFFPCRRIIPDVCVKYFLPHGDLVDIHPDIMKMVTFKVANILDPAHRPGTGMDIILASNLLFHFEPEATIRAKLNLGSRLNPGGFLICHNGYEPEPALEDLGILRDRELEQDFETAVNGVRLVLTNPEMAVYQKL